MRFSVFLNARSMAPEQDRALIHNLTSHAERAAALGFDALFLPDHHFNGYMPIASDSYMFAAYLAAKFPHMHFGFSVTSVPLHHPVRFVERINILDQLTDGKLLVGVGSGTTPEEMIGFGVDYRDAARFPKEPGHRRTALGQDDGRPGGRNRQRPAPGPRPATHRAAAYSEGHARLMPVAMKESSARRAAENAWPAFIPAFTPPKIGGTEPMTHVAKFFGIYRTMLEEAGHSADKIARALDWTTHTYQLVHVADSDEQARDEMMAILRAYQDAIEREAEFNARAESNDANKKTDRTPNALTEDWIGTWCLYGSPETVIEHLKPYEELGIGNILCGTTTGPLTDERLRLGDQTLRLLSEKVMPAFRKA